MGYCANCGEAVEVDWETEERATVKTSVSHNIITTSSGSRQFTRTTLRPGTYKVKVPYCSECGAGPGIIFPEASTPAEALRLEALEVAASFRLASMIVVGLIGAVVSCAFMFTQEPDVDGWAKLVVWLGVLLGPAALGYGLGHIGGRVLPTGLQMWTVAAALTSFWGLFGVMVLGFAGWFLGQVVEPGTENVALVIGAGLGLLIAVVLIVRRARGAGVVRERLRALVLIEEGEAQVPGLASALADDHAP